MMVRTDDTVWKGSWDGGHIEEKYTMRIVQIAASDVLNLYIFTSSCLSFTPYN